MAKWIATRLAQWHKVELPSLLPSKQQKRNQKLWKTMRGWLDQGNDYWLYVMY
jgi:ethanolamine kinase